MKMLLLAARRTRRLRTSCGRTSEAYQICDVDRGAGDRVAAMTATAAGVTPGMRDAWPSVPGRTVERRSTISRESPGMPANVNSAGILPALLTPLTIDRLLLALQVALVLECLSRRSRDRCRGTTSSMSRFSWPDATRASSRTSGCLSARAAGIRSPLGIVTLDRWIVARFRSNRSRRRLEALPALVIHETDGAAGGRQAQVRVVDSKQQSMLRARREHPIRLQTPLRRQIVDHRADVARRRGRGRTACCRRRQRGVDSGDKSLGRRLLVPRCSVDLPGEKQAAEPLGLETSSSIRSVARNRTRPRSRDACTTADSSPGSACTSSSCTSAGRLIEYPLM